MKLLRNPIAVGVLVLLAMAVMAYQFWPMVRPRFARSSPPPPPPPAPAPAHPVAPSAPAKPAKPGDPSAPLPAPVSRLEAAILESNSVRWVEAPRNDPFLVRFYVRSQGTNRPAMEVLTLNAVWQQNDDSPLAVINNHVFNEGDIIVLKDGNAVLQYKISSIEPDRVWVDGSNGREPLRFKLPTPRSDAAEITVEKEVRVTPKSSP